MRRNLLSIFILFLILTTGSAQNTILSVEGGQIDGIPSGTEGVTVYKGIPYAAPPIGNLRWRQPQPALSWEGVRLCDSFGLASLQSGQAEGSFYWKEFFQAGEPEKSEDCLYLNVWTPAAGKSDAKLPVMLWIHGGAFMNGYGSEIEFGGDAYAKKNVILVTINYRLGMCGFLSHSLLNTENGGKGSGNYGLFDQLAALRWVKKNIQAFGGNPDNITVFGQSAGAGSVQALISSPLTEGLIQRAIIQSGGGLGGIMGAKTRAEAEVEGQAMWDAAGFTTLNQMRACPTDKFPEILASYMKKQQRFMGLPYGPVIDGQLLEMTPNDVAMAGKALNIPYMIGYVSEDIAPEVMKKAAIDWSLLLEKQGRKAAYVYCFSRDLPGEDMPDDPKSGGLGSMKGAFHSSELWYVFGTLGNCWRPMEKEDYELSERMVSYWTNFAKTGNPNGEYLPVWEPCTENNSHIQKLDVE